MTEGRDWMQEPYLPVEVSPLEWAFPTGVRHLMPAYNVCRNAPQKWVKFQQDWFYGGLKDANLIPRDGIDRKRAIGHLATIQGSFEPAHEHKEAAVAFLASRWFTNESTWKCAK